VREGVSVDEAADFARYVRVSEICRLMSENPPGSDLLNSYFPYDGSKLLKKARELETACCDYWRGRTFSSEGTASGANKSDLEAIDVKLAALAGQVAELKRVKSKKHREPLVRIVKQKDAA
jgi:hypothetical protein